MADPKVTLDGWKQRVAENQAKTANGSVPGPKGTTAGSGSTSPIPGMGSAKNVPIATTDIRPDTADRLNRVEQEMVVVKRQIYGSMSEAGMVRHIQEMEGKWENLRKDYFEMKRKYFKLLELLGVDDPDIPKEEEL